jgi:leukotriene-A4 hydrolase
MTTPIRRFLAIALLVAAPAFAQRRHAALPPPRYEAPLPEDVLSAADITQVRTTHLALDLTVDFDKYQVRGSATETIENLTGTSKFVVDTRDLDILGVTVDGAPAKFSIGPYYAVGQPLTIDIKPARTQVVRINYASKSNPRSIGLSWLAPLATDGDTAPFLYTFGEPDRTREWIPIQDTPAVRMTYEAKIRVPSGLLAVMSAKNPTETSFDGTYTFTMTQPIPPYLIALAVGRMEFHALDERTGFYAEPQNVDAAVSDLQYVPEMVDAAERVLGPYPFERYDIVLMPPAYKAGGMENPNANFINILSASPGNHEVPPSLSTVVSHELAHAWTGDLVTCATWNDTWLNEGFATYYQARIIDEMHDVERAELDYYFDRTSYENYVASTARTPEATMLHRTLQTGDTSSAAPFNTASYQKGGMFLKMLEDSLGRPAFDALMREWLSRYRFHWADDRAFVNLLSERVGPLDSLYVDEWIYGTGFPPNITVPSTAAMWTRASVAASSFAGGASLASLGASAWTSIQRDLFLWTAFNALAAHMAEVDQTLQMSSKNTASINWWVAMANTRYAPALPSFERFLMRGGGNVLAVYQRLAATSEGKKYALEIYKKARPQYDWGTQSIVDSLLHYAPTVLRSAA